MRKTSIYLDDEQADRLARLARAEGRPQAEIVREAISCYRPAPKRDRNFALAGNFERIDRDRRPISEIPRGRADARLRRVTLILDAAPLVALADAGEPQLEALLRIRGDEEGSLVLPAPVAAEVDYLLGVRFGEAARRAFLSDLAARRYDVACLEAGDYQQVAEIESRYADLGLGLADCSIVILAERYATRRLLTFAERHFRAVTPLQGDAFELLPADS